MDFSPRRSSSTKGRFPAFPSFLGMHKAAKNSSTSNSKHVWSSPAPGIAKRQSHTEWLTRKPSAEYSLVSKLSPTNENLPATATGGRLSQMSASSRSSAGEDPSKVLFDDTQVDRENIVRRSQGPFCDASDEENFSSDTDASGSHHEGVLRQIVPKNPDVVSLDSSRVAQRLASTCSPPTAIRTVNLISFKEEQPEKQRLPQNLFVDAAYSEATPKTKQNGKAFLSGSSSSRHAAAPTASGVIPSRANGVDDAHNSRPKTSLEIIRQQIRQIENELVTHRGQQDPRESAEDGLFSGLSRPLQSSCSSQSIPATFKSSQYHDSSNNARNKYYPHMQRAYSVDVAVHSAISDIQSAVRRSSMIRLKSSTPVFDRPSIEEEDSSAAAASVWVKRDSSAQTEMQDVVPAITANALPMATVPTPELEEDVESESVYLLQETPLDLNNCDNRIGSLSRPVSARRPSCQSAHELIEGVMFRCCYLGSTHLFSDSRPTKASRLTQAQEAVSRIKAPDGESQPMTEVDLFISIEKIMVLNMDIQDILMEHPLRTISYIADIGDLVVLMVKRGLEDLSCDSVMRSTQPKMLCHVFQSDEASLIAQTIGNAFQVAYMEYLKANGIQDDRYLRHLDYLEVLNSQEMSTNELELFASKDKQKDVVIPKQKGEVLGIVIVESGWGSMLPTVIIANMCPGGPAARCGKLSIGDQLISINGISLVGLPLTQCQTAIKNVKTHSVVKLTVVPCPPVVEVRIKRPDTRYQLGFSVQNGIICSLLRGGIAERGGIRVGHRIIEINNQSVVATNHDMIVNMLAHSVGEIELKTMPSSIFRLLTGQDLPVYI